MTSEKISVPRSAYPKAYHDFDSSINIDDSIEGDISLVRDHHTYQHNSDSDSSFDELLDSPKTSRKSSIFKEPIPLKPRGYEFRLKNSGALVYLTYPVDSVEIDTYGKIDYQLETKEKSMVVIIPNSKGLGVNNQKLADAYAIRTGCVTALLDIYFDDPLNLESSNSNQTGNLVSKLKSLTVEVAQNIKVNYWLQSHSIFGSLNDNKYQTTTNWINVEKAIEELLTTHEVENAVLIGFSFGANSVARIAIETKDDRIKSTVLVHPIFLPKNALQFISKSTLLIVGKEDDFYSKDDLNRFESDLQTKKDLTNYKYVQIKLKAGTPHGFAIAGDYNPLQIGDLPSKTCERIASWVLEKI